MPLVSIITPCYNSENTITQTIKSVQSQTFSDWEMIIVDDCSQDCSRDIILSFSTADPRIRLICRDQPSGSPTLPRNIAIENASGRYIAFLDSDDIWHPTKLTKQLEIAEQYKTAFVFSNYEKMDSTGNLSSRFVKSPSTVSLSDMYYGNPIGCLTVMLDMSVIKDFSFKHTGHEDCVAWIEILKTGIIAHNTNTIEAAYREGVSSVSSNKFKILSWQWNIYRNTLHFGILRSCYYYTYYAIKGIIKSHI